MHEVWSVEAMATWQIGKAPNRCPNEKRIGSLTRCAAFWMNNEYRVVYQAQDNDFLLLDIGTYTQVYQR